MEVLTKIALLPPLKYAKRPLVVQQERDNWHVIVRFMRCGMRSRAAVAEGTRCVRACLCVCGTAEWRCGDLHCTCISWVVDLLSFGLLVTL